MCMSKGAPIKPEVGPCHEQHNLIGDVISMVMLAMFMIPVVNSFMKEVSTNGN